MKRYLIALLIITHLHTAEISPKNAKRKLNLTDSPLSGKNPKRHRPSTPFPGHMEENKDDDDDDDDYDKYEYNGLYFPEQEAPPIPATSTLAQRRKTKNPYNPNYQPPTTTLTPQKTPEELIRAACHLCTESYCKGKGWCNAHK